MAGEVLPGLYRSTQPEGRRLKGWVDLEVHHFVLHHPNRRTVIRLTHHIMANRDIISLISLGEGRFYGHEGVMILVADGIFMKMSFPYVYRGERRSHKM